MRVLFCFLVVTALIVSDCAHNPKTTSVKQTTPVKEKHNQEVVIILTQYLNQYDYEILDTIDVELKASYNTLWHDYGISHNPNLTITEEILTKLIKKAQSLGANAITNFDFGSYYLAGHLELDGMTGSGVYGQAIAIKIHNAEWEAK